MCIISPRFHVLSLFSQLKIDPTDQMVVSLQNAGFQYKSSFSKAWFWFGRFDKNGYINTLKVKYKDIVHDWILFLNVVLNNSRSIIIKDDVYGI